MLSRYITVSTIDQMINNCDKVLPRAARMDVMLGCSAILRFCGGVVGDVAS